MDTQTFMRVLEAQMLMGHRGPAVHLAADRATITHYSWEESEVRQALAVPLDDLWNERILDLELAGLTSFSLYTAPVYHDEDGTEHEIEGWRDEPRENWGSLSIFAAGILRLAAQYGRPWVRCGESPAVLAHWELVQAEGAARLRAPYDEAVWAREWPERWQAWQGRMAAWEAEGQERERDDAGWDPGYDMGWEREGD